MSPGDVDDWRAVIRGPMTYPPSLHALRPYERSTALALVEAVGADGLASPGLARLATTVKVSQRSIANYLDQLERTQWIARCPFTTNGRTTYRLTWPHLALSLHLRAFVDDLA